MMHKFICYILGLFILGWFLPGADDICVAATAKAIYISDRIKIQRPETVSSSQQPADRKIEGKEAPASMAGQENTPGAVPAEKPEEVAALSPEEQNAVFLGTQGRFYNRQGRVDPFEPFLRVPEKEVSQDEQEKLQIRPPQTPLERYELGQLKLTGILQSPGKVRALVEEASGKGYIISEGTYIGNKGGQVTKILNDRIVVEEKYLDIMDKVASRDVEIKLRPEGK